MRLHSKLYILFICVLSALLFAAAPKPDVTGEQIRAALPERLEHPYVYFTNADKPAILERIATDPVSKRIYDELKRKADSYLDAKSRKGVDIQALAFVYQMTGDERYAQKAFELLPEEYAPPGGMFDLSSSRRCRTLVPIYDWLYPALNQQQRAHIRSALENEINLIYGKSSITFWTPNYRTNWNHVCSTGLGLAAAALLVDDPTLVDIMADCYNRIYKCFDELGADGGWTEGVGYWSYGTFVSMLYVDALNRLTQGEFNLAENESFYSNPVTFGLYTLIPPGPHRELTDPSVDWSTVNFQDSGHRRQDSTFGYNKIAELTGSNEAIWIKRTLFGSDSGDNVLDILWQEPDVEPGVPAQTSKHFRKYGWVVMRSDFTSADKFVFAAICGEHSDPYRESFFQTHNKLLAGHFSLYWQGEGYLWDTGSPGYPKDYWTRNRWSYARANSFGHNVVHVNGEPQISGDGIGGEVVEFRPRAKRDYALLDPTGAYANEHLKKWRRHLVLDKPTTAVVLDEITAAAGDTVDIRFHSACKLKDSGNLLVIEGKSGLMALIPVVGQAWSFKHGEHLFENTRDPINPWAPGGDKLKDRIVPYMDVQFVAKAEKNYAATIILPVDDLQQAKEIAGSAVIKPAEDNGVIVSFEKDSEKLEYEFATLRDGLRLK